MLNLHYLCMCIITKMGFAVKKKTVQETPINIAGLYNIVATVNNMLMFTSRPVVFSFLLCLTNNIHNGLLHGKTNWRPPSNITFYAYNSCQHFWHTLTKAQISTPHPLASVLLDPMPWAPRFEFCCDRPPRKRKPVVIWGMGCTIGFCPGLWLCYCWCRTMWHSLSSCGLNNVYFYTGNNIFTSFW